MKSIQRMNLVVSISILIIFISKCFTRREASGWAGGFHIPRVKLIKVQISTSRKEDPSSHFFFRLMALTLEQPAAQLSGGERSVIVVTSALLNSFDIKGATVLRAVSSEFRDAIASFPWDDQCAHVITHIVKWRLCFRNARVANLSDRIVPYEAFVFLRDVATLNLARSNFPMAALCASHYPKLVSLNLSRVETYTKDQQLTVTSLAALRCPLLTNLDLSCRTGLTSIAGLKCPLLTTLTLKTCRSFTGTALMGLDCPLLTYLDLSSCSGLTSLAALQCPLLAHLDLSFCHGLTDAGFAALHCPLLTNLNLRSCTSLTNTSLAALQCPLLTNLNLTYCSRLASLAALQYPLLTDLSLGTCRGLTDACLAALQCPRLINLCLASCTRITNFGLAVLKCPVLIELNLSGCYGITIPSNIKGAQEKMRYARELFGL